MGKEIDNHSAAVSDARKEVGEGMDQERKTYNRREFLRIAGIAGASMGLAGGLGGVLSACGGNETSTTASSGTGSTGAETSTTAAEGTTTSVAATTSVSTSGEAGRTLKIGMVGPQTGPLASFAIYDKWAVEHLGKALKDGLACADGKVRQVEVIAKDTQSDSNRAATVTQDLIQNDTVDAVISTGSPDTTTPSADVAEAMACPSISTAGPWQAFYFGRKPPEDGFKWTFGFLVGSEQSALNFCAMFDDIPNNKVIGMLVPNDADAHGWMNESGAPAVFKAQGYTMVESDWYTPGTEDYTSIISDFKKNGCELITGVNSPPDFTNFWKQCIQQGYHPKAVSTSKALLFPQTVDAIGDLADGLIGDCGWDRIYPYKDSLTGQTAEELWQEIETSTGLQASSGSTGQYQAMEWVVDAFKRATNPEDKNSVIEAIRGTNFTLSCGKLDMTSAIDPEWHPVPNVYKAAFTAGQWRLTDGGEHKFEMKVAGVTCPGLESTYKAVPLAY